MTYQTPQPVPAPKRRGLPVWAIVLIVIGAVCFLGAGAVVIIAAATPSTQDARLFDDNTDGPISNSGNDENPPAKDVSLTECRVNEFGWTDATLEVTNNSSKASDYHITVEVVNESDNRLDELFAFIEALRPGQSSEVEANGLEDVTEAAEVTCILLTVDRYSSE